MKTTAGYIRVSSDKQDVARQRDSIAASGTIDLWFEDSEGRNPRHKAAQREGFQRLLDAVERGLVQTIVVDSQDRFGVANAYEWGEFISKLNKHGCELYDAGGKHLSAKDAASVLTGTIGAIASEEEQKKIAHRNVGAKVQRAKLGEYQGGCPPHGLDVVCFGSDGREKWRTVYYGFHTRKKLYPDGRSEQFNGKNNSPQKDPTDKFFLRPSIVTERVDTVRQIFEWFITETISPYQIGLRLLSSGNKPSIGAQWDKRAVRAILRNPAYIGRPAWNKQGNGEFAEYVGGTIREVQTKTTGRKRKDGDYVMPDKPIFEPLVSPETFAIAQSKFKKGKPRIANTAELWLRPFLICEQCGRPMHGSNGKTGRGQPWPSYGCGTYNRYGKANPTGCRCHRVRHSVLEKHVMAYLENAAPKLAKLIETVEQDFEATKPMEAEVAMFEKLIHDWYCDLLPWVDDTTPVEEIRESALSRLRAEVEEKEVELNKMLSRYLTLDGTLLDRAKATMEALEREVNSLKCQLSSLEQPLKALSEPLRARRDRLREVVDSIKGETNARRKSELLSTVVERIVLGFRHDAACSKSYLSSVEIVPFSGEEVSSQVGTPPGRD